MFNELATSAMYMPGWPEMVIFGTLALVIFGPKRLPALARSLGQSITELKRGFKDIHKSIEEAEDEANQSVKEVVEEIKK